MKAIFGVLSLVIVLAVVGSLAKKQLFGTGLAGRAVAADRAASFAADSGAPADATVPQQSKALQQQALGIAKHGAARGQAGVRH